MWRILRRESGESSQIDEEQHADSSCSFTLDAISQLDQDTSTALATIREWRNTFAPINRIPLDVLSLIPTHLPSQNDKFRATFVCRHWRRTFLQHGALWSQMFLKKGEVYTKTLLERAKGSSLDISIDQDVPVDTILLLSPHVQQIICLKFEHQRYWEGIRKFSEINPGPLPFLRTLKISDYGADEDDQPSMMTPPQYPLFTNAINVEEFAFNSRTFQFLNHFIFPNLTTFRLWTGKVDRSKAPDLFDFLQASPTLRTVRLYALNGIVLEDIPRQTIVTLPNVETFSLTSDSKNVYDVAVHISCPHARDVSLKCEASDLDVPPNWEIFPTSVPWDTIVHQYTRSPVEEITLEIRPLYDSCSLTFRSSDASTIKLIFELLPISGDMDEVDIDFGEIVYEASSQGFRTIKNHPLLPNVKCLHIKCRDLDFFGFETLLTIGEIKELFDRMGPLDKLTLSGCELYPYLAGFWRFGALSVPAVFPSIKDLTISHPTRVADEEECMNAIVEFAKSQHAKGIPFERVTVRAKRLPAAMAERLKQWVGVVDCCEEDLPKED